MDDNTLKAIERLCQYAEACLDDSYYQGAADTLNTIDRIIEKVEFKKS